MNTKGFWNLIEKSKKHNEDQVQWLTTTLSESTVEDILDFEMNFQQAYESSYRSDLWGAAYILMGGCSDDSFDYFRGWLVSQGENIFKKILDDPDSMAKLIPKSFEEEGLVPENEDFLYISENAFSLKKIGKIDGDSNIEDLFLELLITKGYKLKQDDIQLDWNDEKDLKERFPKLWRRFGENPLG